MESSVAVMADAQFGCGQLLRPDPNFSTIYQGHTADTPILVAPGGQMLDELAGQPGYSPHLARGLSVPLGARLLLWLPIAFYQEIGFGNAQVPYRWRISWRMRNLADFRRARKTFHIAKQSAGDPSTLAADLGPRVTLLAASDTALYQQAQPLTGSSSEVNLYNEGIRPGMTPSGALPIDAAGNRLVYEQGLFDPGAPPVGQTNISVRQPRFETYEVQAMGDELILDVSRDRTVVLNWNFSAGQADNFLYSFFTSSAEAGPYVFVGSAP